MAGDAANGVRNAVGGAENVVEDAAKGTAGAIKNGITKLYDLAEYFDVSIKFMQNCLAFYINKYGYIVI